MTESFGKVVQANRRKKEWTVKTFIENLGGNISPSYINKIEVHEEIPSPQFIYRIAEVFDLNLDELLELAQQAKREIFAINLSKKFDYDVGFCRVQKDDK